MSQSPDNLEKRGRPEHQREGNILTVDPADLMRDNPAALIVNQERYSRLVSFFDPSPNGPYEHPQAVWVKTYSAKHGEILKLFVIDGLTRTKYIYDHQEEIKHKYPDFVFKVKDVTKSALQDPSIVLPNERVEGQVALTMTQYLRAVVPPTIAHAEIANERIASYLINGWEDMVGSELAEKFSALAALTFLSRSTIADNVLRDMLKRQKQLVVKETSEQRGRLEQSILDIASVIREGRLIQQKVLDSAFFLVSTDSSVIGGEEESKRQVYGLLYDPDVQKKLQDAYPESEVEREVMLIQISDAILAFGDRRKERGEETAVSTVIDALKDKDLNLGQFRDILVSLKPLEAYHLLKREVNKGKLLQAYKDTQKISVPSGFETVFIDQLGVITFLQDYEIPSFVKGIKNAADQLRQAIDYRNRLVNERETLLRQGVRSQTIDEAIILINNLQASLLSSDTLRRVNDKAKELNEKVLGQETEMLRQIRIYRLGEVVNEEMSDAIEGSYALQVRSSIISYLYSDRDIDVSNETQIRRRLRELKTLSPKLQSRVLSGDIRINAAIRLQTQGQLIQTTNPVPSTFFPEEQVTVELPIESPSVELPLEKEDTIVEVDKREFEKRRVETNNERVRAIKKNMAQITQVLSDIDLDPKEISPDNWDSFEALFNETGKVLFQHPDSARVMKEEPDRTKEIVRLREAIVANAIEIAQRDARTGR